MADQFWLTELQMARLRPLLPNKPRGVPRVDDRRVISGIVHVLMSGGRWTRLLPTAAQDEQAGHMITLMPHARSR